MKKRNDEVAMIPLSLRYLMLLLAFSGMLVRYAAAESSFIFKQATLTEPAEITGSDVKSLEDADRDYAYRIDRAKSRLSTAKSPEEKRFWYLDYCENSALRIRYWVRVITTAIVKIEDRVHEIRKTSRTGRPSLGDKEERADTEMKGLDILLSHLENDSPAVLSKTKQRKHRAGLRSLTDRKLLEMTFVNVMHRIRNSEHNKSEKELERSLVALRREQGFFAEQYKHLRSAFNIGYAERRAS